MIDIFLTIISGIIFILCWVAAIYLLAYFQHPADNRTASLPKIISVLGGVFAATNVLLLPLDVAQRNSPSAGLPMEFIWLFLYIMIAILGIIVIPFAIFYIEAEDEKGSQFGNACKGVAILFVVFAALYIPGYIFLAISDVPIKAMEAEMVPGSLPLIAVDCTVNGTNCISTSSASVWTIKLSPITFLITVLSVVGWLLFIIFGGIGLIALPFDLIRSYMYRPQPITKEVYNARKIKIGEEAERLMKDGFEFTNKKTKSKADRKLRNEWKGQVYMLDRDFVHNEVAYKQKGGPAILYWVKLGLGILCILGTLLWVIQIIIWTNLKLYPFINFMLSAMDGIWQFFGTIFFCLFAFYLLLAVVKGNFKWGIRVPFFMTLHPMKKNGTMQNSILVNVVLILIASVAITQYLADSFSTYARATAINSIFNIAIKNLRGIYYYWLVVYWALPAIALLTCIFFAIRPADPQKRLMLEAQKGSA